MLKSGIPGLDEKLQGGFPEKASILLKGPAGVGKTTFCNQFLWKGLKEKEAAIYILFNAPAGEVKEQAKKFDWKLEAKIIVFIDAYSWQVGEREEKYFIREPTDLNTFTIRVSEAIKDLEGKNLKRSAIDALSTLFLYVPQDLALRFSSILLAKLRAAGTTQLVVLEKGTLEQQSLSTLDSLTQGKIELDLQERFRTLRIARMKGCKHPLDWLQFEFGGKGLSLKEFI